jgi:hypothetical protein
MPLSRITTMVFFVAVGFGSATTEAQDKTVCPTKPGIYAKTNVAWTELPREANPVTTFKPNYFNPALPKTNKEFAGEKAFITLHTPLQLCAVGVSANASFSLEKAVAKKGTRTIVQIGNFHDNKGSQSQAVGIVTDDQGNIHLLTSDLKPGQYILVMLGSFKPVPKQSSGNAQTDATTAMMESTTAMVQSIGTGNQGINFGLGIE